MSILILTLAWFIFFQDFKGTAAALYRRDKIFYFVLMPVFCALNVELFLIKNYLPGRLITLVWQFIYIVQ